MTAPALSKVLGAPVRSPDGRPLGRLADLEADVGAPGPNVTAVLVRSQGRLAAIGWPAVGAFDADGVVATPPATAGAPSRRALRLGRDVLDAQVVDLAGRRLGRVGEVLLDRRDGSLVVTGVDVGLRAVLRRMGLRRAAARVQPDVVPWTALHVVSGRGHELLLQAPSAAVHQLGSGELQRLLRRLRSRRFGVMRLRRRAPS